MRVETERELCREYGNCVIEAPDVFEIDEINGKVHVLISEPDEPLHGEVRAAAAGCPVHAITLHE